jgi:uncharacterized protein YyaL (SSP411 family)
MNRLSKETSPYLLQHANNPVDWYPWGPEALNRARNEDKPILLSIGYSACHWCHVMERESFENREIANFMNENFINIKVDREERPDLDQIYQNVAQAITHGGGWPLTVFLTPELKPFYGGTYFPPEDRYGRRGFPAVLEALSQTFRLDRDKIQKSAHQMTEYIAREETREEGAAPFHLPTSAELMGSAQALLGYVDPANGGFGNAPKFPNPTALTFLWRIGGLANSARDAVIQTLRKMAEGGIYDQLGGGFHRYSVDATWSVPHFEKMLYDNAQLLKVYAEALLDPRAGLSDADRRLFTSVLRETVAYLLREMRSPEGAFYAAQDADSEGEEGKYFAWDLVDLEKSLSPEEGRVFAEARGVTIEGNFEHGKTVLYRASDLQGDARALLAGASRKLLEVRAKRVAPATDTKILLSWNALAISGLAWAGHALGSVAGEDGAEALQAARKCYAFVRDKMTREKSRLFATFQGGRARGNAFLDDYAFLARAALDLARFEDDPERAGELLTDSAGWLGAVLEHFRDKGVPGYFFTSDDHEILIHRPKSVMDQAIPSGTAVVLECLIAFSEVDWQGRGPIQYAEAESQIGRLFPELARNPFGASEFLGACALFLAGPVVVSGQGVGAACVHPYIYRKPTNESAKLLVCHQKACSAPFPSLEELRNAAVDKLRF